jgi:hypothetical protein
VVKGSDDDPGDKCGEPAAVVVGGLDPDLAVRGFRLDPELLAIGRRGKLSAADRPLVY